MPRSARFSTAQPWPGHRQLGSMLPCASTAVGHPALDPAGPAPGGASDQLTSGDKARQSSTAPGSHRLHVRRLQTEMSCGGGAAPAGHAWWGADQPQRRFRMTVRLRHERQADRQGLAPGGTARGISREVDYALRSTAGSVAQGLSPSRAIAAMCLATNWSCGFALFGARIPTAPVSRRTSTWHMREIQSQRHLVVAGSPCLLPWFGARRMRGAVIAWTVSRRRRRPYGPQIAAGAAGPRRRGCGGGGVQRSGAAAGQASRTTPAQSAVAYANIG
jgi:hypothetical protein